MLTTTPYLRIRHPSPTAVEFTVTTQPANQRTTYRIINLLRVILGIAILYYCHSCFYFVPQHAAAYVAVVLYMLSLRLHTEESLLVLRGLGIQTSSSKGNMLSGAATTRFIPTEKIQDVLINEAFHGFGVRCCLVVVVDGERDVVVVFQKLLPRAEIVERVWKGVRECLYERGNVGVGIGDGKG
ncbi:GPI-GlcNAc transferase complex, PIG-H component-domain-containing protein [Poronia punctata]|nr:GPI-GlcNAc transferase complex, PIG-H component-domain-containing protein [Poronia punctata]